MENCITKENLREFARAFSSDRANIVTMNTVAENGLQAAARRFNARRKIRRAYSLQLEQHGITWQKDTGRCWMYAGFNVLRDRVIQKLDLEDFTFSGSYLMFYDKLEKANLYLEGVLELIDLPLSSREVGRLAKAYRTDGGEWEGFVSLVKKYGVVPAQVQPETAGSDESRTFLPLFAERLLGFARDLRKGYAAGKTVRELREEKKGMLRVLYRMLAIILGEPVKTFDFQARSKDGTLICDRGLTPKDFYDKYVGVDLDQYISLISGSSGGAEWKKYEFEYKFSGNVIGGRPVDYVSVPTETLKSVAIAQMRAGEPVWFGCDVSESSWRDGGLLDEDLYDYEALFDTAFDMTREERFLYKQAHMSHAMVFKGVDLDEAGAPLAWWVENSWGPDVGENGMFTMTDGWFDQYTYQIVAKREFIPREILAVYDHTEAVVLKPWTAHI